MKESLTSSWNQSCDEHSSLGLQSAQGRGLCLHAGSERQLGGPSGSSPSRLEWPHLWKLPESSNPFASSIGELLPHRQVQCCQRKPIYLGPEPQADVLPLFVFIVSHHGVLSTCLHNVFLSLPICAFITGVSSDSEYLSL